MTVSETGGDGILLDYCQEDPHVVHCLLTSNGNVGRNLVGCQDIVVSDRHVENIEDALHCTHGFNLCLKEGFLDDHLRDGA